MTPLKVRGKRHGAHAGQWHAGKKRPQSAITSTSREGTPVSQHSANLAQKRRRRHIPVSSDLSRLEELPSEVLQTIFEYSANLDLAEASPSLHAQLSSKHLFHRLMDRILLPYLDCGTRCNQSDCPMPFDIIAGKRVGQSGQDKTVASRLLNSKFVTWDFFYAWSKDTEAIYAPPRDREMRDGAHVRHVLGSRLKIPDKVFRGPWATGHEYKKLHFLTMSETLDPSLMPQLGEMSRAAVTSAITLNDTRAATAFLRYAWPSMDTDVDEILRYAVLDCECNRLIVLDILSKRMDLPILDPQLWAWAEKKRVGGDVNGPWLLRMLKRPSAWRDEQRYRTDVYKFAYDGRDPSLNEDHSSPAE